VSGRIIPVGEKQPIYVVAEVGINHQGDIKLVEKFFQMAALHEFDCIKFQKRNPELWPDTPYFSKTFAREMSYREHRRRLEFGRDEYDRIMELAFRYNISWTASVWDTDSVEFMRKYALPFTKIPSPCLTDDELLRAVRDLGWPVVLSTGMSTLEQIDHAVDVLGKEDLILLHCTSTYPASNGELNLLCIPALGKRYGVPVGYSGHEPGLQASYFAGALGACMVERHITYERSAPGSDHAASLGYEGQRRLVRDLKLIPTCLGDGEKRVYDSEIPVMKKLRRIN